MVLHAFALIAALAAGTAQSPPGVQVVLQRAPDPWWKWLLPTVVQTVISLLSIGAGVAIAVWSFRRNRETEHVQWARDQKRAEWQKIQELIIEVWNILQPVIRKEELDSITHGDLFNAVRKLRQPLSRTSFIQCPFDDDKFRGQYDRFLLKVDKEGGEVRAKVDYLRTPEPLQGMNHTPQEKLALITKAFESRNKLIDELTNEFQEIDHQLKSMMRIDLGLRATADFTLSS